VTRFLFLVSVVIAIMGGLSTTSAHSPPPRPEQPRADIFPAAGFNNLQDFNPLTKKVKLTHSARYRLLTMPGCVAGSIPSDLRMVEAEALKVDFTLTRDDINYDVTIRINCGTEHIRICGSVNVFCLGRGFPFNPDIEISDLLSWYQPITRISILLHELLHAAATWGEQYALCGSSCGFAPSPNWRDFMNTGPESRHGFETIEIERWHRTMYEPRTIVWGECVPWGPIVTGCYFIPGNAWVGSNGWIYHLNTGQWSPFQCITNWCGYYNPAIGWVASDGSIFTDKWNLHPTKGNF
jgi:hypothetical protein